MSRTLPTGPGELRRILVRRLGVAAAVIGVVVGAASYWLEARRFERLAWDLALSGARHFERPVMQALLGADAGHHAELAALLDRNRFAGIRVYRADATPAFEAWADIPAALISASRIPVQEWPRPGRSHRTQIDLDGERLIVVMLPLAGQDGVLYGYLEGVTRVDGEALRARRSHAGIAAWTSVASVLLTTVLLYPLMQALLRRSTELSRNLLESHLSLLQSLGNAVAKRDCETDAHNYRVTLYAVALAEQLKLPRREMSDLVTGAFLHDVGKIGIPDGILLKPDELDEAEWSVMRSHVALGLEIVSDNPWLEGAALTIGQHHEHFDGTGYPAGLRTGNIARVARVFAVADVFDALTTQRPYRKPMPSAEALAAIGRESGRHFDPAVVGAFMLVGPALFRIVSAADIDTLKLMLRDVIARYFDGQAAPRAE